MLLTVAAILMIIAIAFAAIEMCIPGFGFFGITAIIFFAVSSIIFILEVPWGIFVVFTVALILFIMVLLAFKSARKNATLIHSENLKEDTEIIKKPSDYIGKEGVTTTALRPFGFAMLDDAIVQVCCEGGKFVEQNEKVKVIGISDNNIVIRPESFTISYE